VLPDDVVLDIFDFYVNEQDEDEDDDRDLDDRSEVEAWQSRVADGEA
jgi:hypothetical protein